VLGEYICSLIRLTESKSFIQYTLCIMETSVYSGYKGSNNSKLTKLSDDISMRLVDYIQLATVLLPMIIYKLLNNKYDYEMLKY